MLVVAAFLATALVGDPAFDAGRRLYDEFEYEQAVFRFQEVSVRSGLSGEDRGEALLWLGLSYAGAGNLEAARTAFFDALRASPSLMLPGEVSPVVEQAFEDARAKVAALPPEAATSPPTAPTPPGEPTTGPALLPIVGVAAGGALVVAAAGLAALAFVTYDGALDKSRFQSDALQSVDTANLELGAAWALAPAGVALAGVSTWFLVGGVAE